MNNKKISYPLPKAELLITGMGFDDTLIRSLYRFSLLRGVGVIFIGTIVNKVFLLFYGRW